MSRTPDDVRAALAEVNTEVITYSSSTRTAQQAADSIGTALGSIVKSLCFMLDDHPAVLLTAGDRRVDTNKVAALIEADSVTMASPEQTLAATGYQIGGVPPVAHANRLPILIDESLGRFETVYAAAGSPHTVFAIRFADLVQITGGQVADIAQS